MDVYSLATACLRRWYALLPLLIITAAIAVLQARNVTPVYSAGTSVVLVPSRTSIPAQKVGSPQLLNPLSTSGAGTTLLVGRLNSTAAADPVARQTGGAFVAVAQKAGGIIDITAGNASVGSTQRTLQAAVAQASTQLDFLQRSVKAPASTYLKVVQYKPYGAVDISYPHRSRTIVLIAIAGVVVSVLLVQLLDSLLVARSRRRSQARHGVPSDRDRLSGNGTPPGSNGAQPDAAQPSVAQQLVAQPSVAQPSVAQQAVAQPSVAQQAATQTFDAQPDPGQFGSVNAPHHDVYDWSESETRTPDWSQSDSSAPDWSHADSQATDDWSHADSQATDDWSESDSQTPDIFRDRDEEVDQDRPRGTSLDLGY